MSAAVRGHAFFLLLIQQLIQQYPRRPIYAKKENSYDKYMASVPALAIPSASKEGAQGRMEGPSMHTPTCLLGGRIC